MTFIQKLLPLNLEEERKKFLFDPNYNPQFVYADKIDPEEFLRYGEISDEYIAIAKKILEYSEKNKLSPAQEKTEEKEQLLSREEVEKTVIAFLEQEELSKIISLRFTQRAIARTSMHMNTLTVRLPTEYTRSGLFGMLYHEIGTHQFRSMNDRQQVWRGKTKEFKLKSYFATEEGLAVLHSQIPRENRLLVYQAINYIAVEYAKSHSFSETYMMLKNHVSNFVRRFEICVRVKRGIQDTSKPGAFSKDQMYLQGAVEVWKWLKKHDFDPTDLYIGKVSLEDIEILRPISLTESLRLPTFVTTSKEDYKKILIEIGKINFFL